MAWAGLAGLPGTRREPPLRGPAQPLAAVRSGACEAVLRKQSVLTHGGSMAPSMAPTVPGSPANPALPASPRRRDEPELGSDPFAAQRDLTPTSKKAADGCLFAFALVFDSALPVRARRNLTGGTGGPLQDRWRHGWRHRAPMDGFTACPAKAHPYRPPRINQGAANGALDKPHSANIAVSFSRAGPASFGLSSAKRIVASTRPRCVPQSKRVPSKR